jgi:ribonucleoside-diphosphate reductase alpha chain
LTADLGLVHNSGKRKGSVAIYLEPWHIDIMEFLDLKKNTGAETERTRDLFTALWIPDEFMRRVQADEDWYLMCPSESIGLANTYDSTDFKGFTLLYNKYIDEKKYRSKIKARDIFNKILESQVETGVPYICFKDNINRKSNQSNIGIVKSSNLCAEIMEVSSSTEYAVCNLGSIAVNRFIKKTELNQVDTFELFKPYMILDNLTVNDKLELQSILKLVYDFDRLKIIAQNLTLNLNNIIDYNYYPTEETRVSNLKNRPIGIGIQGLGDLYYILDIPYSSYVAKYMDALIMETIYYGAIEQSSTIAKYRDSYSTYKGSPFSRGEFQFDLWSKESTYNLQIYPQMHDWDILKQKVKSDGMANSLLTALMPTASTSQILSNNECFEPYSSNIFKRTTLAGEFQVINRHLVDKLIKYSLWNDEIRKKIISDDGSVHNIKTNIISANELEHLKLVYKTIWEIKQKDIIDHALARGPYVDQSQSMNLFFANPDFKSLYSALIYGWKNGIKTGCYYLRSKPAVEAIKYSVNLEKTETNIECTTCSA